MKGFLKEARRTERLQSDRNRRNPQPAPSSAARKVMQQRTNIPPNLHRQQGVNHMNKVLGYAPLVAEDGKAEVFLTAEDWHVVADTLFHMDTPREELPEAIQTFSRSEDGQAIHFKTADLAIEVKMI